MKNENRKDVHFAYENSSQWNFPCFAQSYLSTKQKKEDEESKNEEKITQIANTTKQYTWQNHKTKSRKNLNQNYKWNWETSTVKVIFFKTNSVKENEGGWQQLSSITNKQTKNTDSMWFIWNRLRKKNGWHRKQKYLP